jgi:hypothetical protein
VISDPRVDFLLTKLDQQRKTLSILAGEVVEQHTRVATNLNVVGPVIPCLVRQPLANASGHSAVQKRLITPDQNALGDDLIEAL